MNESRKNERLLLGASLGLFLLQCVIHLAPNILIFDDAYIHIRVATHFATFAKPYFNVDSVAMASSSPLWTAILSVVTLLGKDVLKTLPWLNAFYTSAAAFVLASLVLRVTQKLPNALVALMVVHACLLRASVGLMETPLAVLLLSLSILLFQRQQVAAVVFAVLAASTRLELAVAAALICGVALLQSPWSRLKTIVYSILSGLPCLAYMIYFFGSPIPQTVVAKQKAYQVSTSEFFTSLVDYLATYPSLPYGMLRSLIPYPFVAVALCLSLWLARDLWRKKEITIAMLVWGIFFASVAMYAVKHVFLFPWYIPVLSIPLLVFPLLVTPVERSIGSIVIIAVLLLATPRFIEATISAYQGFTEKNVYSKRVDRYLEIAEYLQREHTNASILASEIGALGYVFQGPILDGIGLATPEAVDYHPIPPEERRKLFVEAAIPPAFAKKVSADIIVSYAAHIGGHDLQWLRDRYTLTAYNSCRAATTRDDIWMCNRFGELLVAYNHKYLSKKSAVHSQR